MSTAQPTFLPLAARTVAVHTVTYLVMGVIAASLLDYASVLARPDMACWMRQIDDRVVMAGPLFQPLRGFVFALVLYPLREVFFVRRHGWLLLWWVLAGLGIVNTFGPAPGSIEGMVYTVIPIPNQLTGYLEVGTQAGLLAFGIVYWVTHPEKKWLTRVMVVAFAVALALPVLGLIAAPHR